MKKRGRGSLGRARDERKEGWKALGSTRDEEREGEEALGSARGEGPWRFEAPDIEHRCVTFRRSLPLHCAKKARFAYVSLYLLLN